VNLQDGGAYVSVPNVLKLTDQHLQYLDILTYTSLKSFNNREEDCFPRHETVGELVGLSKNFVIDSVERLEATGLIVVERSLKKMVSNQYYFPKKDYYGKYSHSQIPKSIFKVSDLTSCEMAMLVCIRQFYYHGKHTCLYGTRFYAKWLGLSDDTVRKQFASLIQKGYVRTQHKLNKWGKYTWLKYVLSDKLNWDFSHFSKSNPPASAQRPVIMIG